MFIVGHGQFAGGKLFLCLQHKEVFAVVTDAVIRDKGDAQADPGQIQQQVVAGQFDLRDKVQLMLLEYLMQEFICRAVFVQHEDRIV